MMDRLVVVNREYIAQLVSVVTPYLYQGIDKLHTNAYEIADKMQSVYASEVLIYQQQVKTYPNVTINEPKRPQPPLKIFQNLLKGALTWADELIIRETERIRRESGTSMYFDDLVRVCVKSTIALLSGSSDCMITPSGHAAIPLSEFHKTIKIENFVHNCYIEACKLIHNNPAILQTRDISPIDIIRNKRDAYDYMTQAVNTSIRRMIPIADVLKCYLTDDGDAAQPLIFIKPPPAPVHQCQPYCNGGHAHTHVDNPQPFEVTNGQQSYSAPYHHQSPVTGATIDTAQPLPQQFGPVAGVQSGGDGVIQSAQMNAAPVQASSTNAPPHQASAANVGELVAGRPPPRPSVSFLLSRSKGAAADEVKHLLDPYGSQEDHQDVEALLNIQGGSVMERPSSIVVTDSISFNVNAPTTAKKHRTKHTKVAADNTVDSDIDSLKSSRNSHK